MKKEDMQTTIGTESYLEGISHEKSSLRHTLGNCGFAFHNRVGAFGHTIDGFSVHSGY